MDVLILLNSLIDFLENLNVDLLLRCALCIAPDETLVAFADDPHLASPVFKFLSQFSRTSFGIKNDVILENTTFHDRTHRRVHAGAIASRGEDCDLHGFSGRPKCVNDDGSFLASYPKVGVAEAEPVLSNKVIAHDIIPMRT